LAAARDLAHEHAHDVRVVAPRAEDNRAELPQLLTRRVVERLHPVDRGDHHPPHLAEDRLERGVLRIEVVVDLPVRASRLLCDVAHAARVLALPRKCPNGGVENLPTPFLLSGGTTCHSSLNLDAMRGAASRSSAGEAGASARWSPPSSLRL